MSAFLHSNDACMDMMATGSAGHFQAAQGFQMPLDMPAVSVVCCMAAAEAAMSPTAKVRAAFTAFSVSA